MILRVGLTGGIASGKSTVAGFLRELGCFVVDADAIVSELYRPGIAGHAAIVARYGETVLTPDGEIDRRRLASIALATPASALELNALIHPLVIARQGHILGELEATGEPGIAVVEATLLIESGGRERFDRIIVVDLPPEMQMERATQRGLDREEAERRMARQLSREERLAHADYVIENSGSRKELREATERVHELLQHDLDEMTAEGG
ncbi:MAG: dephospho-CoA kinase [Thermoanaerobaculia bacterium]